MSRPPNPRSAAYSARSVSELAAALKQAESQLDVIGDAVEPEIAAELRRRIELARRELEWLDRNRSARRQPDVPPFRRKYLDS